MLSRIKSGGRKRIVEEISFPEVIGKTTCVSTTPDDKIVFARRVGGKTLTRFVKDRSAESCKTAVIVLRKGRGEFYILITAFIGQMDPLSKTGSGKRKFSLTYWSNHALVWGTEPIVPGTETTECPW